MSADADGVELLVAAWGRIEAWLQAHAPASAALLRPPAGDADIAAAEAAMGVELPATLAAWYRIHDGVDENRAPSGAVRIAGILPNARSVLPLDELVAEYRLHTRHWEHEAGILPFARTAGDTWSGWRIDARKDEPSYGNLGTWSADEGDNPYPYRSDGWPLPDWLTEIAAALEQGRAVVLPDGTEETWTRPALDRGGLTWVEARDPRLVGDAVVLDGPR